MLIKISVYVLDNVLVKKTTLYVYKKHVTYNFLFLKTSLLHFIACEKNSVEKKKNIVI